MQPIENKDTNIMEKLNFENLDFNLVEATLASIQTKSLTPIIKEELKLKIQSNRLASGKEELPKSVFREPEKCELTAEEVEKRDHRRQLNRVAAMKCRNKRKQSFGHIKTMQAELEVRNLKLRQKIVSLEEEKLQVIRMLREHGIVVTPARMDVTEERHILTNQTPPPTTPTPPPSYMDLPSTSSGILGSPFNNNYRRYSADTYRPPPPYQSRRYSSEVPTFATPLTPVSDITPITSNSSYDIDLLADEEELCFIENQLFPGGMTLPTQSPQKAEPSTSAPTFQQVDEKYFRPLPRLDILNGDEATVPDCDDVLCPTTPTFY